jgi:hypothetical protein
MACCYELTVALRGEKHLRSSCSLVRIAVMDTNQRADNQNSNLELV